MASLNNWLRTTDYDRVVANSKFMTHYSKPSLYPFDFCQCSLRNPPLSVDCSLKKTPIEIQFITNKNGTKQDKTGQIVKVTFRMFVSLQNQTEKCVLRLMCWTKILLLLPQLSYNLAKVFLGLRTTDSGMGKSSLTYFELRFWLCQDYGQRLGGSRFGLCRTTDYGRKAKGDSLT